MLKVLRLLFPFKRAIFLGILSLILVDAAQLVIPLVIREAVDTLAEGTATMPLIRTLALIVLGLVVIIATFRFLWRYFLIGSARRAEKDLRYRLYKHLINLDLPFFHKHRTGDLMAHLTNDIDAVRMACAFGVVGFLDIVVYAIFSLSAMFYISPRLTLLAVIPLPIISVLVWGGGRLIHRLFREVQATFSSLTEAVRESISGIRVIKVFNAYQGEEKHLRKLSWKYFQKNIDLVKVFGLMFPAVSFIGGIATAIVLYAGGSRVILGEISLGDFVAFTTYLSMLIWPMIAIGWVVNVFQRGSASMDRINELLSKKPLIVSGKIKRSVDGYIEFRDLSFSFNGKRALNHINIEIEPGQFVGIVGLTGSGKSTLVRLIPRLLDPPPLALFLDGFDVREYDLTSLRRSIGYVPQDPILFSTTIRENLLLGTPPDHEPPDEILLETLEKVKILNEVLEFPDGLDTMVGERGVTLSGGQRQRLALARAIITQPQILILDDAFSSVDSATEVKIVENLQDFFHTRTTILVTHRLTSVTNASRIFVMDDGRVIEEGTHHELLQRQGFYAKLYNLQRIAGLTHESTK